MLFIIINYKLYKLIFHYSKEIKVCLCAIGKNENKYAREFVEHYKNYGVDKIFIYDNNDIDGERFNNILYDYIILKKVEIINFRGKKLMQLKMLNDCYKKNFKIYDWFILCDMDEFIQLKFYNNIKKYLNNHKFNECKVIYLFRAIHTDNNQLFYINKTLYERFPNSIYNVYSPKPILRGNIPNLIVDNVHLVNWNIEPCYGFGEKKIKKKDFKYYYFDHFYFKSTEEFIEKLDRGDAYFNNTNILKFSKISYYFESNKMTFEKLNYIEKKMGINLTVFKNKLLKKFKKEKKIL